MSVPFSQSLHYSMNPPTTTTQGYLSGLTKNFLLGENKLYGTLPTEIGRLSLLTEEFQINGNLITGTVSRTPTFTIRSFVHSSVRSFVHSFVVHSSVTRITVNLTPLPTTTQPSYLGPDFSGQPGQVGEGLPDSIKPVHWNTTR